MLKTSEHRNLSLPSSVNFIIKSFQGFTFYDNIKTPKMAIPSRQQMLKLALLSDEADDIGPMEQLRSRQQILVDSKPKQARHKLFSYAKQNLDATIVEEKPDHFLNNLKCAAKVNLAFGIIMKKTEDGRFRYFQAHGNKNLLD